MESMFSSNRPGWAALLDEKVTAYLPDLKYIHDEPLARHTSFRIGGPATRMAFPTSGEQIVLLTGFAQECGVTPFLLGNGTNLLVADEGLDTLVIQTGEGLNRIALDGGIITADAARGGAGARLPLQLLHRPPRGRRPARKARASRRGSGGHQGAHGGAFGQAPRKPAA